MANAALLIDNQAQGGSVTASSQAIEMPASMLLTPHPSERWRSGASDAFVVLDKGSAQSSSVAALFGLTLGLNATVRLRLSSIDSTGAAGDVVDTGPIANGATQFDVDYRAFIYVLDEPSTWRYTRFDISDPDADYVEAGAIVDGLRFDFDYNFAPGSAVQIVDRSRLSGTSSGLTLVWDDNHFRRADINLDWVTESQRYGVIQRMDRMNGRHRNTLLMLDTASDNLPRDSIFGLVAETTPVAFTTMHGIFTKQFRIDERI